MISIVSVVDEYNDISHKMDNSQASITNKIKRNTILLSTKVANLLVYRLQNLLNYFFSEELLNARTQWEILKNAMKY